MYSAGRLLRSAVTEAAAASPSANLTSPIKKCSVISRFRSFASGAVFASAVGMYVLAFQLQGMLDEVRSAVHDVSMRQTMIEAKLSKIGDRISETPAAANE